MKNETVFLKLGGSLITDKSTPETAHPEVLAQAAQEIAEARRDHPGLRLLLGHGSGSFGHIPARQYGTRRGVNTLEDWQGFTKVWLAASNLNRIVIHALHAAGLPAVSIPPSAACITDQGRIHTWDSLPIRSALDNGLIPVVFGDVTFDLSQGGTIVSTEDVFAYLAAVLQPARILIAGIEEGVWADYPACTRLFDVITPKIRDSAASAIRGSTHTDVTGGMASKVDGMLRLAASNPGMQIRIFQGSTTGAIRQALEGQPLGTLIHI